MTFLRSRSSTLTPAADHVAGHVRPGYELVRSAFVENFTRRGEVGGACAVYRHGEKVVDLWGGLRNPATAEPWKEDTMVLVYSATKGLAAMTLALAHSRGLLDYEARVCSYWPQFAQHGKDAITVRQLLAHQAALFAFDERVDRDMVADPDRLAAMLARQTPEWAPGTRQAYHAISLGFYEGELMRRIDPAHRTIGQFFQDEIATPLGLDAYIRLPESIPDDRLATLTPPGTSQRLREFPIRLTVDAMNRHSVLYRALVTNPGSELVRDPARIYARNFEVPSGGGVATARSIARAYSMFATGETTLGLRADTLELLAAPAIPPQFGFDDACLHGHAEFLLGFMKSSVGWPFGGPRSYGAPGAGGSLGYADPDAGVGYAYVTSKMGAHITGDPRDVALRDALSIALANL